MQAFINDMMQEVGCSIVNVYAKDIDGCGTEAKITNLTKKMAISLAAAQIRVNAIVYGATATKADHAQYYDENNNPTELAETLLAKIPMNRLAKPEEILGALKYLSDPLAASYTTGSVIYVDGGYTAANNI